MDSQNISHANQLSEIQAGAVKRSLKMNSYIPENPDQNYCDTFKVKPLPARPRKNSKWGQGEAPWHAISRPHAMLNEIKSLRQVQLCCTSSNQLCQRSDKQPRSQGLSVLPSTKSEKTLGTKLRENLTSS